MSYRNREIETKLLVGSSDLNQVRLLVEQMLGTEITRVVSGTSTDTYFRVPEDGNADFARLRDQDGTVILTLKKNDRDDLTNRIEEEITSSESPAKCLKWMRRLLGKESGVVTKTYWVYWTGVSEQDNISCYSVEGYDKIILEVESRDADVMRVMVDRVVGSLEDAGLGISPAPGSLYSMFILGQR